MKEKNEIAKKDDAALMALPEDDFAALPVAEASDYKIPVLTVVQPTSQLEGQPGDIVDSNTKLKMFGIGESVNFVPLWFYKDFAVYEMDKGQRGKYLRREPRTSLNMHLEKFENRIKKDPDGKEVIYMLRNCFFVILEKDLDAVFPQIYLLRYKGSGISESKNVIMTWDRAVKSKIRPYSMLMKMTPKMEKNEKGKFVVLQTGNVMEKNQAKQISGEQLRTAYNWHRIILENQAAMAAKVGEDIENDSPNAGTEQYESGKLNY